MFLSIVLSYLDAPKQQEHFRQISFSASVFSRRRNILRFISRQEWKRSYLCGADKIIVEGLSFVFSMVKNIPQNITGHDN